MTKEEKKLFNNIAIAYVKTKNERLYNKLYNMAYPEIYYYVKKYVKRPDDAQSIASSVFVRFYEKCEEFDFKANIISWIYTIARNACMTYLNHGVSYIDAGGKIRYKEKGHTVSLNVKNSDNESEIFDFVSMENNTKSDENLFIEQPSYFEADKEDVYISQFTSVKSAIKRLPEINRNILKDFYKNEMKQADIALKYFGDMDPKTIGRVKNIVFISKKKIKKYCGQQ